MKIASSKLRERHIYALLIVLSVCAYLPAIVATLGGGMPFRAASDAVGLFGAWRYFASQALEQGILPLWNPHTFCGMPFLSNLQTSVFYPVNWLYNVLPLSFALLSDAIFHHALLLVGAYTLARALRLSRSSALIVALAWGLNGSVSAHSNVGHTTWHAARAFMPWLLWTILLFLRTGRQRYIAGFCALVVLQIAAGYPPMTMLSLALCVGLWIARSLSYTLRPASREHVALHSSSTRYSDWSLLRTATPFLCAMGLALCVWGLPFVELNRASVHGTALPYEEASRLSGSWRTLLRLFVPDYTGGNHYQWSAVFSGAYEQTGYAGLYATLLALCVPLAWLRMRAARLKGEVSPSFNDSTMRAVLPLFLLLPISVVLSLGDSLPLHRWLYDHTFLFQQLRAPVRWIELWVFAVPLLAGCANQYLVLPALNRRSAGVASKVEKTASDAVQRNSSSLDGVRFSTAIAFVLSCALLALTMATPREIWVGRLRYALAEIFDKFTAKQVSEAVEVFTVSALRSCITAVLLSAICYFLLTIVKAKDSSLKLLTPRRAYGTLLTVLALDLLSLFWSSSTPTSEREYAKLTWPKSLASQQQEGQRWTSLGFWIDTNIHLLSDVDALNGYDPMIGKQFYTYSAAINPKRVLRYNDWFVPRTYSPLSKVAAVTHDVWRKGARDDEKTATHLQPSQKFGEWHLAAHKATWPRFYLSRNVIATPRNQQLKVLQTVSQRDFAQQNQPVIAAPQDFQNAASPLRLSALQLSALQSQDRVLDVSRTINTLTLNVNATQPSVLVAAESNFAGWRAWVNGKPTPIRNANFLFRGVEVPRGASRVQMVYEPQTYRFALFLSLCGAMMASAWLASCVTKRSNRL